jgi:hypothetical protein
MWKTRLAILGLLLAIAMGIGLFAGLYLVALPRATQRPTIQNTPALLTQIQSLSHLVTVKYVLEKVVVLEDVKWYGDSRVLMVAHGIVKAGVNLDRLRPEDLQLQDQRLRISLPPAEITDTYLDEERTRIVERATGLLRTFDKELEQDARRQALDDLRRAARMSGILQDAEERARTQITALFRSAGIEVEYR